MVDTGVTEDKSVSKLEELAKEIERLRKDLATSRDRVLFLEARISAVYQATMKVEPKSERSYQHFQNKIAGVLLNGREVVTMGGVDLASKASHPEKRL